MQKAYLLYHDNFIRIENRIYIKKNISYNPNNKILHLVSQIALQTIPLIGTTETLNSVLGSSHKHAQLLTVGNFEITWNLDKF